MNQMQRSRGMPSECPECEDDDLTYLYAQFSSEQVGVPDEEVEGTPEMPPASPDEHFYECAEGHVFTERVDRK